MKSQILFSAVAFALFGLVLSVPLSLPITALINQLFGLLNHIVSTLSQSVEVINNELKGNSPAEALDDLVALLEYAINLVGQAITVLGSIQST